MKALITGITGQDGPYLARLLLREGYEVYGAYRREATGRVDNLDALGVTDRVKLIPMELTEYESVRQVIMERSFNEIYNLAAQSHVGLSFKTPLSTLAATGMGVANLLEAVRAEYAFNHPKIYQAGTSELFGGNRGKNVTFDESTPFYPRSPYAAAKLYAHAMMVNYREAYGMHCSNGILFNHESPLRGPNFVTRKVTLKVADIAHRVRRKMAFDPLEIGNVDATRDWGHAADYVEAMYLMVQQDEPGDYVIATGESHSIRELITLAFRAMGIEGVWFGSGEEATFRINVHNNQYQAARVNPKFFRPSDCTNLIGNATKARNVLGWEPQYNFKKLVTDMVRSDYRDMMKEYE